MTQTQTQNAEFRPSEADGMRVGEINSLKMLVIEYRKRGSSQWNIRERYDGFPSNERTARETCRRYAEDFPQYEFRWRFGWLNLEPSDKCEIFRSE